MIKRAASEPSLGRKNVHFDDAEDDELTFSSLLKVPEAISSPQVAIKNTSLSLELLKKELEVKKVRLADMLAKQQAYGGVPPELIDSLKKSVADLQARIGK